MRSLSGSAALILTVVLFQGCAPPTKGPDKQFLGTLEGAATGAGSGAVTGFQIGSGTGPGALVGAGIGAVAGGVEGLLQDKLEEDLLYLSAETKKEREVAVAHQILSEQIQRRLELHPTREIYPADLFFSSDSTKLSPQGIILARELYALNKRRYPWSRLVIASYIEAKDEGSPYAKFLASKRARALGDAFVRLGLEARRIVGRPVVMAGPVLLDPHDRPDRYSQAIELINADK